MHKIEVQFSQNLARFAVSLFTREWIEIIYAGFLSNQTKSPSLRGSGLKFCRGAIAEGKFYVSLFTREWIEIVIPAQSVRTLLRSPSLRGSGLKYRKHSDSIRRYRLPLYEGVD